MRTLACAADKSAALHSTDIVGLLPVLYVLQAAEAVRSKGKPIHNTRKDFDIKTNALSNKQNSLIMNNKRRSGA